MIRPADTLRDWCDRYALARALAKDTHRHMRRSCNLFAEWLGQAPTIGEVDEDSLSEWLESIHGQWSPSTCRNHRANILMIVRFAADCGARPEMNARRVRRVRVPPPDPHAWPDAKLAAFFEAAAALEGVCRARPRVTRASYLLALGGSAYDSGLRRKDLFKIRHESIGDDGVIRLRQNKTSEPHVCALTPHVLSLVRSIPYEYPLKWTGQNAEYVAIWKEAKQAAGIEGDGGCHQMRRNAATAVWEESPELVQRFLGHRTPTMWRYYVDQSRSVKPILPRRYSA